MCKSRALICGTVAAVILQFGSYAQASVSVNVAAIQAYLDSGGKDVVAKDVLPRCVGIFSNGTNSYSLLNQCVAPMSRLATFQITSAQGKLIVQLYNVVQDNYRPVYAFEIPCDEAAREFLALNAKHKLEDFSKAEDFEAGDFDQTGDAGNSIVNLTYVDPSDKSIYSLQMFGEGCAFKSLQLQEK